MSSGGAEAFSGSDPAFDSGGAVVPPGSDPTVVDSAKFGVAEVFPAVSQMSRLEVPRCFRQ